MASLQTSAVQVAGVEGEVVLGREFAGRTMAVETLKPGVWIVKVGSFVPDSERWLLDPQVQATLDRALDRAQREPYRETDLDELEERILGGSEPDSAGSE